MKKNILFMAQLPPPVHGAALRNQSLLESQLINTRFKLFSLPLNFIDDMKSIGKFSFRKIFLMIVYAGKLIGILATKKIDLVYFTMSPSGGAFYRDILFITIIKIFRKKRILHFRVKGLQKTAGSRVGRLLIRYAFKNTEIVCLSKHHMADVKNLTWKNPFIVPNGIRIETEYLHLADEYPHKNGQLPKILFLSNLSRKKGVPELIEALSILKREDYQFVASLVGDEWDMSFDDVNELISKSGLQGIVTIEGPKYAEEKYKHLADADVFVFPTYFELFPGVVLEAMQFGRAIVSTFEGSIPEIIDNGINGLLVAQRDSAALSGAIALLLKDPKRRDEMGKRAREKFFAEFTQHVFEERMANVFEEVIN